MKLPKVNKKVATVVVSGVVITSATTAGALMITNPFENAKKANVESSTQQEPEVTTTPVTVEEPVEPTQSVVPTTSPSLSPTTTPDPVNTYAEETMMYYVFNKRIASGKVAGNWGFPNSWPTLAKNAGLAVDRVPQKYDAAVGGQGVWFVESVNSDGSITISSYNAGTFGPGESTRTIPSNQIPAWQFIH